MLIPGLPNATNMWGAILTATNGLTWNRATRTVTLGGSLTGNTTIELGASNLEFTQGAAPVLTVTAGRRVGIGVSSPATQVNTSSTTTNQTDGATALGSLGFGYETAQAGYAGAIVNTNNATSSNGLLVRIARNSSDARIATFMYNNGTAISAAAIADGRWVFGTVTNTSAWVKIANNNQSTYSTLLGESTLELGSVLTSAQIALAVDGSGGKGSVIQCRDNTIAMSLRLNPFGGNVVINSGNTQYGAALSVENTSNDKVLFYVGNGVSRGVFMVNRSLSGVDQISFFGAQPAPKPTITGSRSGGAAYQNLLTALNTLGLITDSTTA